ncbi:MAG: hypothetical protein ABIV06_09350 [Thermoanaerobaculia bacterium]
MLASSRLPPPAFRFGRLTFALGFAGVVGVAALVHHGALLQPEPQQDEPDFVEAAELVAAGQSPYLQEKYNYPPLFASLGARALDLGGTGLFLGLMRGANLLAVAGLAIFAAGFAGLSPPWRFTLAAALVAFLPIVHYTFWIGNTTPVAAALALAGWRIGAGRPLAGAALVGASLAFKPIALVGALYLTARRLIERPAPVQRWVEALTWIPFTALGLVPWAGELPALLARMREPPIFSSRNLSFRRVLDGFGMEMPAAAITLAVLAIAFLMARRRPIDELDRVHTAPVVALLALPVAWAHGFLLVLPLQVAAARRYWDRRDRRDLRATRRASSAQALAERWGVPLALALIQASASAGVEFAAPEWLRATIVLLPLLAPVALLTYLRCAASPAPPHEASASQNAAKTSM